jgi:hypothetical protein
MIWCTMLAPRGAYVEGQKIQVEHAYITHLLTTYLITIYSATKEDVFNAVCLTLRICRFEAAFNG